MTKLLDIPKTEHYAIIKNSSRTIYHEGDQRSRDYPGHGYPAYNETIESIDYRAFNTMEEIHEYLKRWSYEKNISVRVFKVVPLEVEYSVTLKEPK